MQNLERDLALDLGIERFEHDAHPTGSDLALDHVASEHRRQAALRDTRARIALRLRRARRSGGRACVVDLHGQDRIVDRRWRPHYGFRFGLERPKRWLW